MVVVVVRSRKMRVFDRGKEMIGDERVKEIENGVYWKEMLSVERVFGDVEDEYKSDDELMMDEMCGELGFVEVEEVDFREIGNYWELNDGIGKNYGLEGKKKFRKGKFGWVVWSKKDGSWVKVECGELWGVFGVCVCGKCRG